MLSKIMEYAEQKCKFQGVLFVFLGKGFDMGFLAFVRMNNKNNIFKLQKTGKAPFLLTFNKCG